MTPHMRRPGALSGTVPLLLLAACAVNPVTGAREFSLISESEEIEMGRDSDGQVTAAYGLVDDPELQAYVSDLGQRMAAGSERPDLPWAFKVVDDPTVNAFALPGGFIYVTRGILTSFDSEAELAGVLGHEIAHVTAKHSVSQMSRQQLQQIALGVGMAVSETVAEYGRIGAAALQVLNLRYSRGDETEADEYGLGYMAAQGYDPDAMIGVFQMLAQVGAGGGGGRLPEWQLTHPYPENREDNIRRVIVESGLGSDGRVGRDAYLDRIDGLVYGPNPREGFFRDRRFLHPELAFELTFPGGWSTRNQRSAVVGVSPGEDAVLVLEIAEGGTTPRLELDDFLRRDGVSGGMAREDDAGGVERARATFDLTTQESSLSGEIAFVRSGAVTYRIVGYAARRDWSRHSGSVSDAISSFGRVTDPSVLGVEPLRLGTAILPEAMSLARYHERLGSAVDVEELARLNRTVPGAVLSAGTRIKTVSGTPVG